MNSVLIVEDKSKKVTIIFFLALIMEYIQIDEKIKKQKKLLLIDI